MFCLLLRKSKSPTNNSWEEVAPIREQDACCVLSLIKLMVIILHANVSSVVHQPCSCSRLQSAVFYLRDPITARLGAGWSGALRRGPSGTGAAPELPLALAGPGEPSLNRKTRSRTENSSCSAALGYRGRLGNGRTLCRTGVP